MSDNTVVFYSWWDQATAEARRKLLKNPASRLDLLSEWQIEEIVRLGSTQLSTKLSHSDIYRLADVHQAEGR